MRLVRCIAAAIGLLLAGGAGASAAGLVGDTVSLTSTVYDVSPASATVVAGGAAEFAVTRFGADRWLVNVEANSVAFILNLDAGLFPLASTFSLTSLDFSDAPSGITGISVAVTGNAGGATASNFSFTAHSLSYTITGAVWGVGSVVTVTFQTAATAVPEPATLALLGSGLLGLMGLRRARKLG